MAPRAGHRRRQFRRGIQAGIDLWLGKPPQEASPLPYKDRDELKVEAADGADPVAARLGKLMDEHGPLRLGAMLERRARFASSHPREAHLRLSAAHKAKGLESHTAALLDDFWSLYHRVSYRVCLMGKKEWTPMKVRALDQDLNLVCVAVMRAEERLYLPTELYFELASAH